MNQKSFCKASEYPQCKDIVRVFTTESFQHILEHIEVHFRHKYLSSKSFLDLKTHTSRVMTNSSFF